MFNARQSSIPKLQFLSVTDIVILTTVLKTILTVTTVWNAGETGYIYYKWNNWYLTVSDKIQWPTDYKFGEKINLYERAHQK